ncbi:MAG TPA: GyrI-like domain-containing protein [Microlunatus sp.]|nr:GyrI-like domain-containing protein [Microlunatus sp.]
MMGQRPLDFWLRLVDDLLNERVDSALEEHGVTRRQWAMINLLTSGTASRADLDAALAPFLPPPDRTSSTQEELSELVDSGWISQENGSYALTDRGRLVHGRLEAAWARRNDELMRGISAADVSHLIGLLERLARNLGWAGDSGITDTLDRLPGDVSNGDHVEVVDIALQPVAVIRGRATTEEISGFLGAAFAEVLAVLEHQQHSPAGPPFGRYLPESAGTFDIVAGFPSSGVIEPAGRVEPDELPGGHVARIVYRGDYAGVGKAYEALRNWVDQHGYVSTGPAWESYLDEPDVPEPRTMIQLPCRAPDSQQPGADRSS